MAFIMELEGKDCCDLFFKAVDKMSKEIEFQQDKFLLHLWGYMLPNTKEPLSFTEFKKQTKGEKPIKATKQENEDLIERIESIKKRHQEKNNAII